MTSLHAYARKREGGREGESTCRHRARAAGAVSSLLTHRSTVSNPDGPPPPFTRNSRGPPDADDNPASAPCIPCVINALYPRLVSTGVATQSDPGCGCPEVAETAPGGWVWCGCWCWCSKIRGSPSETRAVVKAVTCGCVRRAFVVGEMGRGARNKF